MFKQQIEDNCEIVWFGKMVDIAATKHISFGLYSFTIPLNDKPPPLFPCDLLGTAYIGQAGRGYSDFAYDLKTRGRFPFRAGYPYERGQEHRHKISAKTIKEDEVRGYKLFRESFDRTEVEKVYFSVIVPKKIHPATGIKAWLSAYESIFIYQYWFNFGHVPFMNTAHAVDVDGLNTVPKSIAGKLRNTRSSRSLKEFMNG